MREATLRELERVKSLFKEHLGLCSIVFMLNGSFFGRGFVLALKVTLNHTSLRESHCES